MTRITLQGRDWTAPAHVTDAQRERMEAPIASEFTGRWGRATWGITMLVGFMGSTALFAWWLS